MNGLIEGYLRSRGVRWFRGHHDDEYFFLVDSYVGRLNVHLEVCGAGRDAVLVSVTPDRYYPADKRDRLTELAGRWNGGDAVVLAAVHDSCDPTLVGISAESSNRPVDLAGLTGFVDDSVASAIELLGRVKAAAVPVPQADHGLRDAG